jgi:hypothetical protein
MKCKVKFEGSAPSKTPNAMKTGGEMKAPMAGKPSRKTVRGAGAATRGKSYTG